MIHAHWLEARRDERGRKASAFFTLDDCPHWMPLFKVRFRLPDTALRQFFRSVGPTLQDASYLARPVVYYERGWLQCVDVNSPRVNLPAGARKSQFEPANNKNGPLGPSQAID
jgi:hypothetical protein